MNKDKLKRKIELRFRQKQTGKMVFKLSKYSRLKINYMFGNKYSLTRVEKGKEQVITLLNTLDKIIDLMYKEKTRSIK